MKIYKKLKKIKNRFYVGAKYDIDLPYISVQKKFFAFIGSCHFICIVLYFDFDFDLI